MIINKFFDQQLQPPSIARFLTGILTPREFSFNPEGIYTFYKVCLTGDVNAVCLMIDNGLNSLIHTIEPDALPSPHDNDGSGTALFLACLNGHTELVNALLDRGADPNYGGLFSDASFIRECESSEMDRDLYKNEIERDNPIVVASKNGHLSIER